MGFRITQNMLNQNMLYNLQNTTRSIAKYQQQLSSGKKVNRPSDDPVATVQGMAYQNALNEIQQYKSNAQEARDWMNTTDDALDEVTQVLQRVRELTVKGSNGTNDVGSKTAIADEIQQLKEHLGAVANAEMAGKYLFAGTDTKTAPYDAEEDPPFINTNTEQLNWEVGKNTLIAINVNGTDVFDYKGSTGTSSNIFGLLDNIVSALKGDTDVDPGSYMGEIDEQADNLTQQRSELGARVNRMDLTISRLDSMEVSTTSLLANQVDVDIAQVITQLQMEENVQSAALSVGARVIQPTLVDFLK